MPVFTYVQVMQTERLIYLVTEYASGGEIFGNISTFLNSNKFEIHSHFTAFHRDCLFHSVFYPASLFIV